MRIVSFTVALFLSAGAVQAAETCTAQADDKKLAGAARTSFTTKCEKDSMAASKRPLWSGSSPARPGQASSRNARGTPLAPSSLRVNPTLLRNAVADPGVARQRMGWSAAGAPAAPSRNDEGRLVRRPSLAYPRLEAQDFAIAGLTVPAPLVAAGARLRKPGISIATSRRYARYLSPKRAIRSCSSSWMAIRM